MLNLQDIEEAIAELEASKTTLGVCSRLADLYAVRDHAKGIERPIHIQEYSQAAAPIVQADALDTYGDSDFLLLIAGKAPSDVWEIIDGLMNNLQVTNLRLYDSIMYKISRL